MKQRSYMWLGCATILSSLLLGSSVAFAYDTIEEGVSEIFDSDKEKTRSNVGVMYQLNNNVTRANAPLDIRSDQSISLKSFLQNLGVDVNL